MDKTFYPMAKLIEAYLLNPNEKILTETAELIAKTMLINEVLGYDDENKKLFSYLRIYKNTKADMQIKNLVTEITKLYPI